MNQVTAARVLGITAAAAIAVLGLTANAHAQGSSQEWLPDCSAVKTTKCVVSTELNGAPTTAVKANVAIQSGGLEGTYYQVYFTQPELAPSGPGGGNQIPVTCPGGGNPQPTPDGSGITCPGGEQPIFPTTPPSNPGGGTSSCASGYVFNGRCGDLTQVAPVGSKLGVTVNVGTDDPKVAVVRGGQLGNLSAPNKTWSSEKSGDSTVVKAETVLGTSSKLDGPDYKACTVFPVLTDCGGPTAVAEWTGTQALISLLNLDSDTFRAFAEISKGLTIATNAQANGPPLFDRANRTLSFQTAAPHFEKDGTTLNEGFIYTFIPDSFLQAGPGFGLPPGLTPKETLAMLGVDKITAGSGTQQVEPTVSDVEGGVIYSVPKFGFSSPKFDYLRRKAAGAFTSKATATKKKVSVTLEVGGKSKVSIAGKLGSKSICTGSKSASRAASVTVPCKLSSKGKKALAKAKAGARVNVKVTLKAKKTETKNTYALVE